MTWSRNYSARNTRLLRSTIARGRIVVNVAEGIVTWPNGKPIATEKNFWGYIRFRIKIRKRKGAKLVNAWFFVHKAVVLARGQKLKRHHEINHIDGNRANNRGENLEYIHRRDNLALIYADYGEPAF